MNHTHDESELTDREALLAVVGPARLRLVRELIEMIDEGDYDAGSYTQKMYQIEEAGRR